MWPYWVMFLVPVYFALRPVSSSEVMLSPVLRWHMPRFIPFLLLSVLIGLRHEVGGDWFTYLETMDGLANQSFFSSLWTNEPAYALLNWFGYHGFGGIYFVNLVCGMLFSWGLILFCSHQTQPWLALVVAMPYLVVVVAMGYTRQSVALGFVMWGLMVLQRGQILRFVRCVVMGAAFHKTALLLLPLVCLAGGRHVVFATISAVFFTAVFYVLFLQSAMDHYVVNYLDAQYQSSGALIRILMNAVSAVIFLRYRDWFHTLTQAQKRFWTWMAWAALGLLILLWLLPSSTAVDRLGLYWLPLQVMVLSHVPDAFGQQSLSAKMAWVLAVVLLATWVLFTWLLFAATASAWLPYRFYLTEIWAA